MDIGDDGDGTGSGQAPVAGRDQQHVEPGIAAQLDRARAALRLGGKLGHCLLNLTLPFPRIDGQPPPGIARKHIGRGEDLIAAGLRPGPADDLSQLRDARLLRALAWWQAWWQCRLQRQMPGAPN